MIKILVTVAVLGSVGSFAGFAVAQDSPGEAFGNDVSASLAKKEALCAHRRMMPPDPRDGCVNKLRSDAQIGYGQGGALAGGAQASAAGAAIGPGNGGGQGNGIGPGNGGGQGKGRR